MIINGDCLIELEKIENNTVQLICIDPPYNINKDTWDNIPNYQEWLIKVINKLIPKLKPNGSFFIFHNDMPSISKLMVNIEKHQPLLKFNQMIVWNKRFNESKKKGFMDGFIVKEKLNNWNKMAEYILFYTIDNHHKFKEARLKINVKQTDISRELLSKNGNITGWYSNIELGKNYPTRENMKIITKHLHLEYEDIVPKYHNLKTDHSVWNYDMAKRCEIHVTPKPINLLKNIILHTTDENDIVLDCFGGTGSIAYACEETNRRYIIIEKEKKYYDYICNKLNNLYNVS